MPVTGYVRGLVPGKRYRMVLSAEAGAQQNIVLPSIEFVVPSAPDLISSYTPVGTLEIKGEPYIDNRVTPGTGATTATFNVTHWSAANNSRTYTFWVTGSGYSKVRVGSIIRFGANGNTSTGLSNYEDADSYYDTYDYQVVDKQSSYMVCNVRQSITSIVGSGTSAEVQTTNMSDGAIAAAWCRGQAGHYKHQYTKTGNASNRRPSSWTKFEFDGRALGAKNKNPNTAVGTVYIPRVPSSSSNLSITKDHHNVNIEIPDNFPLFRDQNVIDIPVFAYKNRTLGTWHNMDHTPFIAIDHPIQYSAGAMNTLLRGTSNDANTRDGIPINMDSLNVNNVAFLDDGGNPGVFTETNYNKEYYFTIARYKKVGSTWQGSWLQSEDSEPRVSDPEAIIWSQKASGV
jgi:hypothetical protein